MGLTPIHALVGPNDSGKSTILRGLRTVVQFAVGKFDFLRDDSAVPAGPFDPTLGDKLETALRARLPGGFEYGLEHDDRGLWADHLIGNGVDLRDMRGWNAYGLIPRATSPAVVELARRLRGPARMVHFAPSSLRAPSPLLLDDRPVDFLDASGYGLPAFYDALLSRRNEVLAPIQSELRRLFPTADRISFRNVSPRKGEPEIWKAIEITLHDGARIPTSQMSEGLLYFLAFSALQHAEPTSLLLVEEPENGLHPARIRDVVGMLREISKTTQVVMATHSPLVINELTAEEVSVVWRTQAEGTQVVRLNETYDYAQRSKILSNGELWLAYADGVEERELREKPSTAP
jgi:energy-coupling factor transporter ATP-binding protein EcfA2